MAKKTDFFLNTCNYLWSIFLSGLFTILPLTLTLALFNFSFKFILNWLEPVNRYIQPTVLSRIPYAEIILVISLILLVGAIMKIFVLRSLVHAIEELIFKLPLIRPVYSGIKQLVGAFSIQDKVTFKNVVIVEFPRTGVYSLGFMTSELPAEIAPNPVDKFYNVFIPTTPNPTTGFLVLVTEKDVTVINLTRQEAMAMIISGGIIQPDRFVKAKAEGEQQS
jgi:uncharacterized membrane protein